MNARPREIREVAVGAVLLGVVGWGIGPLLVRGMSVSGVSVSFYRMWLAVPVMVMLARMFGEPLDRRILRNCALPGVLFAFAMMFGFQAMRSTSIANATLIGQLCPAFMVLGAGRFVGERSTPRAAAAAFVSFVGLAVMIGLGADTSNSAFGGDVLAFCNVLCFTGYFLLMKRTRNAGVGSWAFLAGVFVVGAIALTPYCLVVADDIWQMQSLDYVRVVAMIFGPGVLGHGLIVWATKHLEVTTTSLLTLLSPPISVIGAWIVYEQSLVLGQLVGAVIVLAGLAGTVVVARTPRVPEPV
ncbi:MAG: DMT family transporter [Actinomycetota bacterium]|nr:DMT family transporter [Actinomycetota bacterium]MDA2971802.1 DMT family transporter [Actinomycetota bacterium]MDA3001283.1 DMT family transporter [Actinomycetota bacterium]